jgi:2-polyprenyl-3-methyl-5-hydroxy-6-metoxy-1,4-benzoquinol methylase
MGLKILNDKVVVLNPEGQWITTPYDQRFIDLLKKLRSGSYIEDEILRSEYSPYLLDRICILMDTINLNKDINILDFGGGAGGSAVCLAKLGYKNITTIDTEDYKDIYELRLKSNGIIPNFVQKSIFDFNPGKKYDAIIAYAVYEHLNPFKRKDFTDKLFSLLEKGGYFIIGETPSVYFIRNSHSGWFFDWLPLNFSLKLLLLKYKKNKLVSLNTDIKSLLNSGLCTRGVSINDLIPSNSNYKILPINNKIIKMEICLPRKQKNIVILRNCYYNIVIFLSSLVNINKLMPQLNIIIKKV